MFKLVSLTAFIALAQANAETTAEKDAAQVEKRANQQFSKIKGMATKKDNHIWKQVSGADKTKYWSFQTANESQSKLKFESASKFKTNADFAQATCFDCYMSGNNWDTTTGKCALKTFGTTAEDTTDKSNWEKADVAFDHSLTYGDYITMAQTCFSGSTLSQNCQSTTYSVADFEAKKPTNKVAGYTWGYHYDHTAEVHDTTVCQYTAVMPSSTVDGKTKYSFKGGLLLSQNIPDSVQPIVSINNGKAATDYLMNRLTLEKASVGTTKKVIVPFADSIDVVWTNTATISAAHAADFSLSFERRTNSDLAVFALEHGGVIVWVIIGIVVLCLLCVGVIVWKKCFSNKEEFYLEDAYARV